MGGFGSAGRDKFHVECDAVSYPPQGAEWAGGRAGVVFESGGDWSVRKTDRAVSVSRDPCRRRGAISVPLPLHVGVPLSLDARLPAPTAIDCDRNAPDRVGPAGGEVVPPRVGVGRIREGDQADGG